MRQLRSENASYGLDADRGGGGATYLGLAVGAGGVEVVDAVADELGEAQ